MQGNRWRTLLLLVTFVATLVPSMAFASAPVPTCRLDDELATAVQLSATWGLQDLKASGTPLPFDKVAINPRNDAPARTLPIYLIKDAATSVVDRKGCIRPVQFRIGSMLTATDGPCVATRLDACTEADREYMQLRFQEIHGNLIGDSETGYESAGACYMTNLHACLLRHRLAMLAELGPRDAHSVKGTCIANASNSPGIRCSAGALKMLLSSEAVAENATTLAMVLVLGHELGHIATGQSSSYDATDNIIDLSWSRKDKLARLQNQCRTGESLRKRERDADAIGLRIAKHRIHEIARNWPRMGTTAWLITQAAHQSTNLTRWNNDWQDRPKTETPRAFLFNPDGGVIRLDGKDLNDINEGRNVSGRSAQEVEITARQFLCELIEPRTGEWNILIQSGSTHGTMAERLGELLGELRPIDAEEDSPLERLEAMLGSISDTSVVRHRAYLRELEGAICTLVSQPIDCTSTTLIMDQADPIPGYLIPDANQQNEEIRIPVAFSPKGPYKEVIGKPRLLNITIGTYNGFPSMELAKEGAQKIATTYSALLTQIDEKLIKYGGYWLTEWHSDVKVSYNMFADEYLAIIELRAIARVPSRFKTYWWLPALRKIRKWGQAEHVHVRPWNDARPEVIIHFYRRETPGNLKGSQRVLTSPLRFDQIYDLAAALNGQQDQPAAYFRDLLAFVHNRLKTTFGGAYTLYDEGGTEGPFYISFGRFGDNLDLPISWYPLINSTDPLNTPIAELRKGVDRVYIDNSRAQDVSAIFGEPNP